MKKLSFIAILVLASSTAMAADSASGFTDQGLKYFAYFFAMGIAAFGGTTAQSKAASAALTGIARNPAAADKVQTPMILALALMESLVIFTLISVFLV